MTLECIAEYLVTGDADCDRAHRCLLALADRARSWLHEPTSLGRWRWLLGELRARLAELIHHQEELATTFTPNAVADLRESLEGLIQELDRLRHRFVGYVGPARSVGVEVVQLVRKCVVVHLVETHGPLFGARRANELQAHYLECLRKGSSEEG